MITRRDFAKLSISVTALMASGKSILAALNSDGNVEGSSARRIGRRALGSYWGSHGEKIDLLSGNLNFSYSVAHLASRTLKTGLHGSYNSQIFTNGSSGVKKHASDTGYGFGWLMQFAAIKPIVSSAGSVNGYRYIDSFGSEYVLTQNGGQWVSLNGNYITWDLSRGILRFPNGSSMRFGCVSGSLEPDAGSMYPTSIHCANGNVIEVQYMAGHKETAFNTSSRILSISDAESNYAPNGSPTYSFTYSEDEMPRLASIMCNTAPGNSCSFAYSRQAVVSPFGNGSTKTQHVFVLSSVTRATGVIKQYQYNEYGEMISAALEKGAVITWDYQTFSFADDIQVREVVSRSLYANGLQSAPQTHYFNRDASDLQKKSHSSVSIADGSGSSHEYSFTSDASDPNNGLLSESKVCTNSSILHNARYEWSRTSQGAPYISARTATHDPGAENATTHRTETSKDEYGNTIESRHYDSSTPTLPARIVRHAYLKHSSYLSQHILNRRLRTTVSQGSKKRTVHEAVYDSTSLNEVKGASHHNSTSHGSGNTIRGNVTESVVKGVFRRHHYDTAGQVVYSEDSTGTSTTVAYDSASNNTRVSSITPNQNQSLAATFAYDQATGRLKSTTGANGASSNIAYDNLGRVNSTTDSRGVTASFAYDDTPGSSSITTTLSTGKWTRHVQDGLGRTLVAEHGDATGITSQQEHKYGPVLGHPSGKLIASSVRHAPSDEPVWGTQSYDAMGRMTSKSVPSGRGTQTISHQGNSQTVTDGAGRWKRIYRDAGGRIIKVVMPDATGGPDAITQYAYDVSGHLTQVFMPRSNGAQTRTFQYDDNGRMALRQHAESGPQTFIYNADGTLASKTDAKKQKEVLVRDSLKRVVSRNYYDANGALISSMASKYFYDSNPIAPSYSQNAAGRLAAVQYGSLNAHPGLITEMYSYTAAGSLACKRVYLQRGSNTAMLESSCSYDSSERVSELSYPQGGPTLAYSYDDAGRLSAIRAVDEEIVRNVSYTSVGSLANFDLLAAPGGQYLTERHEFDQKNRLTRIAAAPSDSSNTSGTIPEIDLSWSYSDADSRVVREDDNVNSVSIGYHYDNNGRLAAAESSDASWGLAYSYDGFGNRTSQTVTQGSSFSNEVNFDPSTNWILSADTAYDANGNVISLPYLNLEYDARNRLNTVRNSLLGTEHYAYDLNEHRIWKKLSTGKELFFFYQNSKLLATYAIVHHEDGTFGFKLQSTRSYFGGRVIRSDGSSLVLDRLGAVRGWSDKNGAQTTKYLPFGEQLQKADEAKSSFGGYERDASGLDYAWHRYYSSRMGRFATPDPYEKSAHKAAPDSWNRYAFVCNDPINRVDPTGFDGQYDQNYSISSVDINCNSSGSCGEVDSYNSSTGSSMVQTISSTGQGLITINVTDTDGSTSSDDSIQVEESSVNGTLIDEVALCTFDVPSITIPALTNEQDAALIAVGSLGFAVGWNIAEDVLVTAGLVAFGPEIIMALSLALVGIAVYDLMTNHKSTNLF